MKYAKSIHFGDFCSTERCWARVNFNAKRKGYDQCRKCQPRYDYDTSDYGDGDDDKKDETDYSVDSHDSSDCIDDDNNEADYEQDNNGLQSLCT
jgi:hypothetical protein